MLTVEAHRQEGGVVHQVREVGVAGVDCQVGGGESRLEADAVWQGDVVQDGHTFGGVGGVGGKHTGLEVVGKRGQLIIPTAHNRQFISIQAGESW